MSLKHLAYAAWAGFAALLLPTGSHAQPIGAPFQSRDPATCSNRSAPARGPMTAAIARAYVACSREGVRMQHIYLVAGMDIEVGRSRPFQQSDQGHSDIDPAQPVYPIRGRLLVYFCARVSDDGSNAGKNCDVINMPAATGECYRTTFGDWTCDMSSPDFTTVRQEMPPPT